ncbi:MAG: signal peptidase I [Rhodothermales bacterium]|nr:signal peptidase I [Rhodothermales bacterium]
MLDTLKKDRARKAREDARARRRAEREAARGGANGRAKAAQKPTWKETLGFWAKAIVVILLLRAFLFEPFRIPTPSMEKSLLVGDFLFVSKLHYGARTPNTIGIPFTGLYIPGLELPQVRLPGFDDPDRGDVAVFNYPPEDGPIERKTPYIKRLVAMPGDTLRLLDKQLYVNGRRQPLTETMEHHWQVSIAPGSTLPRRRLEDLEVEYVGVDRQQGFVVLNATPEAAAALEALPYVETVAPYSYPDGVATDGVFPAGSRFNRDNYGPLLVPAAGMTVRLTAQTWPRYRDVITRFEGRRAEVLPDGRVSIDGEVAETYTFEQDYYFAMGDNRDNSQDSRFWGFVPADHLVGKAVLVFFSIDTERFLPRLRGLMPIR